MYNYNNLKKQMIKKGYNQKQLAKELGIYEETLSRKFTNHRDFTQTEIYKISKLLDLKKVEDYFLQV